MYYMFVTSIIKANSVIVKILKYMIDIQSMLSCSWTSVTVHIYDNRFSVTKFLRKPFPEKKMNFQNKGWKISVWIVDCWRKNINFLTYLFPHFLGRGILEECAILQPWLLEMFRDRNWLFQKALHSRDQRSWYASANALWNIDFKLS